MFGRKLRHHARAQGKRLVPGNEVKGPNIQFMTASGSRKPKEAKKHGILGTTQEDDTETSDAAEGQVEQVVVQNGAKNPDSIEVVSQEK